MNLYRRTVPKIAKDLIQALCEQEFIEVEEEKSEEAELDVAAVMVQHLDGQDFVIEEARKAMTKRGIGAERFAQVKKSIAEARKVKIGQDAEEELHGRILYSLFESKHIVEIYAQDNEIRKVVKECIDKYTHVPEEVDQSARERLKNMREGTPEWEIEYPKVVNQIKRQKGLLA